MSDEDQIIDPTEPMDEDLLEKKLVIGDDDDLDLSDDVDLDDDLIDTDDEDISDM